MPRSTDENLSIISKGLKSLTQTSCDQRCFDLAKAFLKDALLTTKDRNDLAGILGGDIQEMIEEFVRDLESQAERQPE